MSKRHVILGGLLILCVVAVIAAMKAAPNISANVAEQPLFVAELVGNVEKVNKLTIGDASNSFTLYQKDDGWHVQEKNDYPANVDKIRKLLVALSLSHKIETKTQNPVYYERLGLSSDYARSVKAYIEGQEKPLFDVELGNVRRDRQATYAKYAYDPQTWLVSGSIDVEAKDSKWFDRTFFTFDESQIRRVVVDHKTLSDVMIEREAPGGDFSLHDVPKDRVIKGQYALYSLSQLVANLEPIDVVPVSEISGTTPEVTHVVTFSGVVMTLQSAINKLKFAMIATARFDEEQSKRYFTQLLSERKENPLSGTALEEGVVTHVSEVRQKVEAFNARTKDWAYSFKPYVENQLRERKENLLKSLSKDPVKKQK